MAINLASKVDVVFGLNDITFTQGMKAVQSELDKFGAKSKAASHTSVSSLQATQAAVGVLNGGVTNMRRSVERFIATIPGAGTALKVAFPLIGGVAFGSMIVDLGVKVADFVKKANAMPQAIQKGFQSLSMSQKTSNDMLDVTNDKLQNSIDKLEHKPTDGLKLGLDEARVFADHLAESLSGASDRLTDLLSKNHLGGLSTLLGMWGTVSTAGREGTAKYFNNKISTASNAYENDPSEKNHTAMINVIKDALKEATDTVAKETAKQTAPASGAERFAGNALGLSGPLSMRPNNTNVLYDAQGAANYYQGMLRTDASTTKGQALTKQNDADLAKKDAAELAKQQSEQAKQAAHDRVAAMQTNLDSMKMQYSLSTKAVFDYWEQMKSSELAGGTAYNDIVKKQAALAVEGAAKAHEAIAKFQADSLRKTDSGMSFKPFTGSMTAKSNADQTQGYLDSNQSAIDSARNTAMQQEAQLTDGAGKSMSRYAEAIELAKVHTQEFITVQAALQAILDTRQKAYDLDPSAQNQRVLDTAKVGVANANSQRGIQIDKDAQNANPTYGSAGTGAADAINDFVNASKDAAGQMRDLVTNTLQGLNAQILNAVTGQKTNFKQFGSGVFRSVASTSLQKGEGALMGAFGGGKLGATSGNAMWVRMASSTSSTASGIMSKMFGGSGGSQGPGQSGLNNALSISNGAQDSDSDSGGIGTIASTLMTVLPMLASGGSINGPAIVGEQGPELFIPHGAGQIIPNHKLTTRGGGGGDINIDASSSTDPAQTRVQVMRGIQAAAPHISANTIHAQNEMNKRKPSSKRK